jgi:hypothetical protein
MKTPRITMTDAMMSETEDSTTTQYNSHTGAVPSPISFLSVNEPTTRINAQMIITVERPSNATTDIFRDSDINDWFTTIIGMLTTRMISISTSLVLS